MRSQIRGDCFHTMNDRLHRYLFHEHKGLTVVEDDRTPSELMHNRGS